MGQTGENRLRVWLRLALDAFILSTPAFVLSRWSGYLGLVAPRFALLDAVLVFLAVAVLHYPLIAGLAALASALDAMAADETATPESTAITVWCASCGWRSAAGRAACGRGSGREADLGAARAVLAALPEPLILLDEARRVVSANAAATALLGDRLEDRDLAGALRHPAVLAAADAGAARRGRPRRRIRADEPGRAPSERASRAAVRRTTADGAAAVLMLHDLTAIKRSERLRADFVANASHELRTPLATLVGFIETLRGPAREDEAARERFLAIMAEQAGRMTRLVDDLLSLSRIEMNEHRPPTGAVDLAPVIETVAEPLEQRAAARGMRIVLDLPPDLPPVARRCRRARPGLPEPARQRHQIRCAEGTVSRSPPCPRRGSCRAARRPAQPAPSRSPCATMAQGIAREHLPRLTERFYRVDPARSRELGGTGLGLAIVKHIVSHHRGALDIESELGQGSVFTVHLPAAAPPCTCTHAGNPAYNHESGAVIKRRVTRMFLIMR